MLIVLALLVEYPESRSADRRRRLQRNRAAAMRNRYVLAFSAGAFLYVGVEAAIYVWMPTLLAGYTGTGDEAGRLQHLDLLPPARRRPLPRRLDADPLPVAGRAGALQRRHSAVLRRSACWGRRLGGLSAAAVGAVHVGDLSHAQFQGHQLPAEVGARCRRGRHPVLHLCVGRARAAGDGRGRATRSGRSCTGSGWRRGSRRCCSSACC